MNVQSLMNGQPEISKIKKRTKNYCIGLLSSSIKYIDDIFIYCHQSVLQMLF